LCVVDLNSERPEVGIYVGEVTLWGRGIASEAIEFAVDWIRERGYTGARARIDDDNEGSQQAFEKVGFRRTGDARENESEYRIAF
jgi:RimJ/RimL family protein N-acetyltransferase